MHLRVSCRRIHSTHGVAYAFWTLLVLWAIFLIYFLLQLVLTNGERRTTAARLVGSSQARVYIRILPALGPVASTLRRPEGANRRDAVAVPPLSASSA